MDDGGDSNDDDVNDETKEGTTTENRNQYPDCCACKEPVATRYECYWCKRPCHLGCSTENDDLEKLKCSECSEGTQPVAAAFTASQTKERTEAKSGLEKQASKMLSTSFTFSFPCQIILKSSMSIFILYLFRYKKFPPIDVASTVRIAVPTIDRNPGDTRNILAVVLDHTEDDMYKLGTRDGVIDKLYSQSKIAPSGNNFVSIDEVPQEKSISLRRANANQSLFNGQGYNKCNCKGHCQTNRCACRKKEMLCSSRCHGNLICNNK